MSAVWVIRPGEKSKNQGFALEKGCAVIGWSELGDIRDYDSLDKVRERVRKKRLCTNPDSTRSVNSAAGQVWAFANRAKKGEKMDCVKRGDWVILPRKGGVLNGHSAIGTVTGSYGFRKAAPNGCMHQRPVDWKHREFPDSGLRRVVNVSNCLSTLNRVGGDESGEELVRVLNGDAAVYETDSDVKRAIIREFPAKKMEELVRHIVEAMGYKCEEPISKGADGGLDIVATHPGELIDPVCGQVKNTRSTIGAPEIQQLAGAINEHPKGRVHNKGLFVSMGGFGDAKQKEALKKRFPHIRLWDADDILRLVREYCGKIDDADCRKRLAECGILAAEESVQ